MMTLDQVYKRLVSKEKEIQENIDSLKAKKEKFLFGRFLFNLFCSSVNEDIEDNMYYLRKYRQAIRAMDKKDYKEVKIFFEKVVYGAKLSAYMGSESNVNPDIVDAYEVICKELELQKV